MSISWRFAPFAELSGAEVYDILALRQRVFMREQNIPVQDADGMDAEALHLLGVADGKLVAYARLFVPSGVEARVKIGRVVVSGSARGQGLGKALMLEALARAAEVAPGAEVKIAAQAYLEEFYRALDFETVSGLYDDHSVPHVDMVRKAGPTSLA